MTLVHGRQRKEDSLPGLSNEIHLLAVTKP